MFCEINLDVAETAALEGVTNLLQPNPEIVEMTALDGIRRT